MHRSRRAAVPAFAPILLVMLLAANCRGPLSPEVTEQDLRYHLGILSSDGMEGRMTGTPAMLRAVNYIVAEYRRVGLYPFFPDYIMRFPFTDGVEPRGTNRLDWTVSGRSGQSDVVPMPFGKPGATIEGEMVLGGWCMPPHDGQDELQSLEANGTALAGKILICKRHGPDGPPQSPAVRRLVAFQAKYENAKRFHPVAILFLQDDGDAVLTQQFPVPDSKTSATQDPVASFVPSSSSFSSALAHFAPAATTPGTPRPALGQARLAVDFGPVERTGQNIGAMLRPHAENQRLMFVGAHYDHLGHGLAGSSMGPMGPIYNGADDNGSGTVLVLELAAAMKARLDADPAYLPADVNVVFLNFDAEERGLFGSSRFVDSPNFDASRTLAMLNADMVGRLRKSRGLFVQGTEAADPSLRGIVEKAFHDSMERVLPPEECPDIRWMKGGQGPSDHASFYRKKVPVVFLFTGSHGEYHRPDDDDYLINYRGLRAICLFSEEIVRDIALAPAPPRFRQVKEEPHREDFDFKVRLGIIPGSYDTGINGVLVGGLVEGAPVRKTGIKEGDLIVELGGTKIRDIRDLMAFLNDARTGVTYSIRWIRNGQVMESSTELMSSGD